MIDIDEYISVDSDVLAGQPVFRGTRVAVESLFNHLEKGISIDEFLLDFPSVRKEVALIVSEANSFDTFYKESIR